MGYAGKIDLKLKACELRKQGWSIKAIQKELKVARSSVGLWTRDIKLNKKQLERLYLNKKTGALRGSVIAAQNKIRIKNESIKKLRQEGKGEVGSISKRDKFIAGIALYFAEGSKTNGSVQFSNSDPGAIKFMAEWLRDYCHIANNKFRGSIYLHDNLDEDSAKIFWSKLTKIPIVQFTKTYKVRSNPNRFRKTKNKYGVFRITVCDVYLHRKIMGWISGIIED